MTVSLNDDNDSAEVLQRLSDALAWLFTRESGFESMVTFGTVGRPRWVPLPEPSWVAPLPMTLTSGSQQFSAELWWPVPWNGTDYVHCGLDSTVSVRPGNHEGCYVGRPLVSGRGVRLKPGLHFIPRIAGDQRVVDVVLAPSLGRDFRVKKGTPAEFEALAADILGKRSERFLAASVRGKILENLSTDEDDFHAVATAVRALRDAVAEDPAKPARRTARTRNRLFGHEEVMAELLFARLNSMAPRVAFSETSDEAWMKDFCLRATFAAAASIRSLGLGQASVTSVVAPLGPAMTLARIEQASRTCFVGFRGLGKVRGRADLRDLEDGWRGTLCPVQTTESAEVGLIRYLALGEEKARTEKLEDWFDLSASAALIPFINHDDPARASIGSKNLKQAVPVIRCEPPLVATGWEKVLGTTYGILRVAHNRSGEVSEIGPDFIAIRTPTATWRVGFGSAWTQHSGVDNSWKVLVEVGDEVEVGQVVAHAPDVRISESDPASAELCLGVNALVALTPWEGLNFEDSIVVSTDFASRMTSQHLVRITVDATPDDAMVWLVQPGDYVDLDDQLGYLVRGGISQGGLWTPEAGEVVSIEKNLGQVAVTVRATRQLAVGDKLSNRHQNKGVVSAILPPERMPHLPDGTAVEVILNPVGVLRRLNIGQLWEMHVGLAARNDGKRRTVGRRLTAIELDALKRELADLGATNGRVQLTYPDGTTSSKEGIVVGPQYLMKLDHMAVDKLSIRGDDRASAMISRQPTNGTRYVLGSPDGSERSRKVGSAQRLGEMEVWALEAEGARSVLDDALNVRSAPSGWAHGWPRASLRSVAAHLAVAGIRLGDGATSQAVGALDAKTVASLAPTWRAADPTAEGARVADLEELPNWKLLGRTAEGLQELWIGTPDDRPELYQTLLEYRRRGLKGGYLLLSTGISGQMLARWRKADSQLDGDLKRAEDAFALAKQTAKRRKTPLPAAKLAKDDQAQSRDRVDPLYSPSVHGEPGSRQAEVTRWSIPLPSPIQHPWQQRRGPQLPQLSSIPVLPPTYRLRNPSGARGLDYLYLGLVEAIQSQQRAQRNADNPRNTEEYRKSQAELAGHEYRRVHAFADRILGTPRQADPDSIWGRLAGKRGLLRRYLLGQSVTSSGRGVIVPDWDQEPDEVGLPAKLAGALGVAPLDEDGEVVFIVRQPTLQPHSIVALRARYLDPRDGDAIRLHPITLGGLAGDFDGDTVAVHRPATAAARAEAWRLLSPAARLRSSANGTLVAKFDLDIALGLYLASGSPQGRAQLETWFDPLPERLDATGLAEALANLTLPPDRRGALRLLARIEQFGLEYARGWSIGALDLVDSGRGGAMAEAIAAGVAGSSDSVAQLLDKRGAVLGAHPDADAGEVTDSFLAGLNSDDFFATAPGALASLALKKLATPHAGAFTKSLVEIADPVTIVEQRCASSGERSPLTCTASGGVCQECYGNDPGSGNVPAIGSRVGVLAAMLVGERWTQISMKAFHGGGQAREFERSLQELQAVFGRGRSATAFGVRLNGRPRTLTEFWNDSKPSTRDLGPAVERAFELLQGKVNKVHIEVLLRQVMDTVADLDTLRAGAPPGHRQLVSCAERRGRSTFEIATARGNVVWLLDDSTKASEARGGPRTRLATGDM